LRKSPRSEDSRKVQEKENKGEGSRQRELERA
jgi:hypothetical protein